MSNTATPAARVTTHFECCYYCGAKDIPATATRHGDKPLPHLMPNGREECVYGTVVDAVTEADIANLI